MKNPNAVKLGKLGGEARWKGITKKERSDHMRMMANTRHARRKSLSTAPLASS